jgi:hypothetical protein
VTDYLSHLLTGVLQFMPLGRADGEGRIPIRVDPIDIAEIREKIDQAMKEADSYGDDPCSSVDAHSSVCEDMMDRYSWPCLEIVRQRRKNLDSPHLLRDCARNPGKADGLRSLEGVVRGSCVMDVG